MGLFVSAIALLWQAGVAPQAAALAQQQSAIEKQMAAGLEAQRKSVRRQAGVPVAQSDFIFSAIAEEAGLVGTVGLVCLMILLVYRGFRIAFRARSSYDRLLAAGITSFIAFQSILIVGGNLRVLPLTGVTLPFISYGGSSLLVSMICAGILLKLSDTGGDDPMHLEKPAPYFLISGITLAGFFSIL